MRIHSLLLATSTFALSACGAAPPGEQNEQPSDSTGDVQEKIVLTCPIAIKTQNGHYLTAVDGGGHATNAMASNRTQVGAWEIFIFPGFISNTWFQTSHGNLLTADAGGNRTTDAIKTNRTQVGAWEQFSFVQNGNGTYAIRTFDGHYLTAVGGGGLPTSADVLHTNATSIGPWEQFRIEFPLEGCPG